MYIYIYIYTHIHIVYMHVSITYIQNDDKSMIGKKKQDKTRQDKTRQTRQDRQDRQDRLVCTHREGLLRALRKFDQPAELRLVQGFDGGDQQLAQQLSCE